jgi:hypothetical protein
MCHTGGTAFRYHGFAMSNETKRCPKCERELPTDQFNKRANGRCYAYCKACQSLYLRDHYLKNTALYYSRRLESNRRYRNRNRTFVLEYLGTHPCVDCGESDPIVLEFDHIDPKNKQHDISDLTRCGYSLDRLKREIERCEVRCIHCHRRRTAKQFSWKVGAI